MIYPALLKRLGVRMKRDLPTHLTEQVDTEELDDMADDEPDAAESAPDDEARGEP
nr:hypothetical protein BN993_04199 [Virgibacillus halodenitrificans]